jgi:hypothetical protein
MMMLYNCSNTCLYILRSTLILISCIASLSSLDLCLVSLLPKGESICKVGRALTNRVVERRNMINIYLNGESMHEECCGEFVSGVVF